MDIRGTGATELKRSNRPSTTKQSGFSFSLSNLSATMNWRSKSRTTSGMSSQQLRLNAVDPLRHFYYPEVLRPLDSTISMIGPILSTDRFSLNWAANTTSFIEDRFYTTIWNTPEDVDLKSWYWLLNDRGNANLTGTYALNSAGLTFQASTGVTGQMQYRPYLFDERISPTTVHPFRISDYNYSMAEWNAGTKVQWLPLRNSAVFSNSNISYSWQGKIARLAYQGLSGSGIDATPNYDLSWLAWNTSMVTDHSVLGTLTAKLGTTNEQLSLKAALPPLLESYTIAASSSFRVASIGASYVIAQKATAAPLTSNSLTANIAIKTYAAAQYCSKRCVGFWAYFFFEHYGRCHSMVVFWKIHRTTSKRIYFPR